MDESYDLSKRVFAQMFSDVEISDIVIPPMKMPKSFRNLLFIGYASYKDSNKLIEERNNDSSDDSSDSSSPRPPNEWAHIFDEDGRLRFKDILSMLPPIESEILTRLHMLLYEETQECTLLALDYYNANNQGEQYELVSLVTSNIMHDGVHSFCIRHVNFIAKPSNNINSPWELFYAEVIPSNFLLTEDQNPVPRCCILKPQLCGSSPGDIAFAEPCPGILHPPEVDCLPCRISFYDSDTDED